MIKIIEFSNETSHDKKLLKKFVHFHWDLYENDPKYIPLLDFEYLGLNLIGMKGYFQKSHNFFKHGRMKFFIAMDGDKVVGRTCAFINDDHNDYYNDKVGFFGFYESINDSKITTLLLDKAAAYLKSKGMNKIRGPINLPINESTPGCLISGFDALPVIYYHYNHSYYQSLFLDNNFSIVKKVVGMDVPVQTPVQERLLRVTEKVKKRYSITIETFSKKRFNILREQMFEIYNEAWKDNWGFVPFRKNEFFDNLEDMKLVWDPNMFIFAYVKGEPAGFFGSVPNILEVMKPGKARNKLELIRALKMIMMKGNIKASDKVILESNRNLEKIGLDAVLISEAKKYTQNKGYQACDIGWVLEDNDLVIRMADFMGGEISRTYAIFEKDI